MKKKTLLLLLVLSSLLASCGSGSGKKNCDGDTCKIGYRIDLDKTKTNNLNR